MQSQIQPLPPNGFSSLLTTLCCAICPTASPLLLEPLPHILLFLSSLPCSVEAHPQAASSERWVGGNPSACVVETAANPSCPRVLGPLQCDPGLWASLGVCLGQWSLTSRGLNSACVLGCDCPAALGTLCGGRGAWPCSQIPGRGEGGSGHPSGSPAARSWVEEPSETTETHPVGPAKSPRPD